MKQQVDQHRSKRHFQEGDQVFLQLQPYKQTSLKDKGCHKLSPKFYGPYRLLQRIGEMAYKLALPPTTKIHQVFHLSCLKKVIGINCRIQTSLPELDEEGSIWLQPEQVLDTRVKQLRGHMIKEVLVIGKAPPEKMQPGNQPLFCRSFRSFRLEDKASLKGVKSITLWNNVTLDHRSPRMAVIVNKRFIINPKISTISPMNNIIRYEYEPSH
eukprot:PITA_06918